MRFPTKPQQLPTTTPTLLSFFASASAVATTSLLVALPRTISTSRMTFAGLKKCSPITMRGREVTEAISSISSVEVFDASTQSGFAILSISAKILFFSSMLSNAASMIRSACSKPS